MTSHLSNYFRYWGKAKPGNDPPYHPLAFHCLDVAAVGRTYLARRRSEGLKILERTSKRKIYHDVVMDAKRKLKEKAGAGRWTEIADQARPSLYELVHETVRDWFCGADGQAGVASRCGFSVDTERLRVDAYRSTVDITGELESDGFQQVSRDIAQRRWQSQSLRLRPAARAAHLSRRATMDCG